MKVTFILHSSFFVELESCCLLFDYYEGAIPQVTDKPLYVFASHCHGDHFSPAVFSATEAWAQRRFFLSDDIWQSRVPEGLREATLFVSPQRTYEWEGMKLATLRSTDQGVAFLVEVEGKLLYHAGDLNCWVWDGAPRFQNDQAIAAYREELRLLEGRTIHTAFVPLDPRQEADFDLGMRYFFEAAEAEHVFPMHMWGDYSVVPLFKSDPHNKAWADRVMDISAPGQAFTLN